MSDLCTACFPPASTLAGLAERAQSGERAVPIVGDGSPATVFGCAHGSWVLGDVLDALKVTCAGSTKAGEPCKATPKAGSEFCVRHEDQAEGTGSE